jgi:PAS domain S-box-containing protein
MDWLFEFFKYPDNSQLITGTYDLTLVFLSVFTAILSSFMSLQILSFSQVFVTQFQRNIALLAASISMGTGVWSMHFIGMLTLDMHTPVNYDLGITFISMLPSIAASAVALHTISKKIVTHTDLIKAGVLVGAGIGVMHYTGMAAMQMGPEIRYDFATFCLSIVAAISLAILALWIRFDLKLHAHYKLSDLSLNIISALVMGSAISTMHYIGMSAARFVGQHDMTLMNAESDHSFLAFQIAVITLFSTVFVLGVNLLIKYRIVSAKAQSDEHRLQVIMNTTIHGIVTINSHGTILSVNDAIEPILGWAQKELTGQNVAMFTPPEHTSEQDSYLNYFLKTKKAKSLSAGREIEALHKYGHLVPIHLAVGYVQLAHEDLFVGYITDISDRIEMENDLRENEEKYRTLISNIPGAAYRCQAKNNWQMLFISDAIKGITGYNAIEFLSTRNNISFGNIIYPEDTELTESILIDPGKFQIEYRIFHQDGSIRWVLDSGECIKDEAGVIMWLDGFIMDITERKMMETQLVLEKDKAEQATAIKSNFLANMSHEIRTPMNAIVGFSDILLDADMAPEHHKHLSTINNSAHSLLHLINDILDSAKIEKGKLTLELMHFSLRQLIDLVISTMWLPARKKSLHLELNIDDAISNYFYGAEDRIRQVLVNLLGNAIKFTHEGKVSLDVYSTRSQWLTFKVTDTGIGIAPERLHSIFEPFTQADASMTRRFGGTGLGTSISKQLVELMGGKISAKSTEGIGSCFEFEIPLDEGDETHAVTKQTMVTELEPLSLLIADDIQQNLDLLETYFVNNGHTVATVKDGQEAINLIKTEHFDVILMDVQMPKVDGHTASQTIIEWEQREGHDHTPIIALTASVLNEDKVAAKEAGMDGFASKPVNFNEICTEIARVTGCAVKAAPVKISPSTISSYLINSEEALSLWHTPAKYLSELNRFIQNNNSMPEQLDALLLAHDHVVLMGKAHALRGVTANLAIRKLEAQFILLEDNLKMQQFDPCTAILERIKSLMDELTREYDRLNQEISDEVDTNVHSFDRELFQQTIEKLILVATENEFDEHALKMLKHNASSEAQPDIEAIESAFEDFDFDVALNLLEDIKMSFSQE